MVSGLGFIGFGFDSHTRTRQARLLIRVWFRV